MLDNTNCYGIITRIFGDVFTCKKYKKLKRDVEDLLNIIHCDNNHFTNTRGHEKSCNEAKRIVIEYQKQLGLHRHD